MATMDPRYHSLAERDADYRQLWNERFGSLPLRWLDRDAFWDRFDAEYKITGRTLTRDVEYPLDLPDLRSRIREAPTFTPFDEDFPGPVERWYGAVGPDLFLLTYYYHAPPFTILNVENETDAASRVMNVLDKLRLTSPY
jgi:hypothetical protein